MQIQNLRDLYVEQLKDLYSAESQAQDALQEWRDAATSDELTSALSDRLDQVSEHQQAIRDACEALDAEPTGHKCKGTEGIVREGQDLLSDVEDVDVRDAGLIAIVQRMEHYNMAGYGCARTYALQLDHGDVAERLQRILESEASFDDRLTRLAQEQLNLEAMAA